MFKIKTLEKETVPFVCEIMFEPNNVFALHTNTISLEEWKSIFERAEYDTDEENFIVYQNDTPCCWLKINGLQNKYTAWISMLVVSERFKHQGVGKFAVEFAIEYLAKRGYQHINLQTTADNLSAIRLYEKSGFKETAPTNVRAVQSLFQNFIAYLIPINAVTVFVGVIIKLSVRDILSCSSTAKRLKNSF